MEKDFRKAGVAYRSEIRRIPDPFSAAPETGMASVGESGMERMLREIRHALEDDELDDFACIDRILEIYAEAGLYVSYRHDFG